MLEFQCECVYIRFNLVSEFESKGGVSGPKLVLWFESKSRIAAHATISV
jgi:hypothetical protein